MTLSPGRLPFQSVPVCVHENGLKVPLEMQSSYGMHGWHSSGLPSTCACSTNVTVEHAMNFPTDGFPTMQPNELRNFIAIASLLSEVCQNVHVCVD